MTSYISSFRALLLAIFSISLIEILVGSTSDPSFLSRSNLLQFGFGEREHLHRLIIYRKTANASMSPPGIVQVGDSSGFHAIDPTVIEPRLGGLSYFNLSCCANTGFPGYYDLASLALSASPPPALLVLYISPLVFPQAGLFSKTAAVNPTMVSEALTNVGASLNPPSMAFRQAITAYVFSMGGRFPSQAIDLDRLFPTLQSHAGWAAAQEHRHTPAEQAEFCRKHFNPREADYSTVDFLGRTVSFLEWSFGRVARLARRHNVRLAIVIDTTSCELPADWIERRREEASRFAKDNPDVLLFPASIVQRAPYAEFVVPLHVAPEYHSQRSMRLLEAITPLVHELRPQ